MFFDRVYLVNLKRRPDRLEGFRKELAKVDWPFPEPVLVPACDGRAVPVPATFKGGQGAWGCIRSHLWCLEQALTDNVSVLILEDDAFFPAPDTFKEDVEAFLALVPEDWDGVMLGGQHISGGPRHVKPGLVKATNCQRTHAYGLRPGRWMRDLYSAWLGWHTHCDHKMGGMMSAYNVYCPEVFLIGQSDTKSDITCRNERRRLWSKPPAGLPCVLLKAPQEVRDKLGAYLHFGYTIRDGIDVGLTDAYRQRDPRGRLSSWLDLVGGEAWIEGKSLAVYHPAATLEQVQACWKGPVVLIEAKTLAEALDQLPDREPAPEGPVVLLKAGKDVAEELRGKGWHFGYWRSPAGIDIGLLDAMASPEPIPALKDWIATVGAEAKGLGAVLALRHPGLTLDTVQEATDREVIEVEAKTAAEALEKLKKGTNG